MNRLISILLRSTVAVAIIGGGAFGQAMAQQQQPRPPATPAPRAPAAPAPQRTAPAQAPAAPQRAPATQPGDQAAQQAPQRPPQQPLPAVGTATVIFDSNGVIYWSTAGSSARTQLERRRSQLQQELAQQEADLRKTQDDIEKQRAILSPDAFAQRGREFQGRVQSFQQGVQDRDKQLVDAERDASLRIRREIISIVNDILQEQKYQVVLEKSLVVFAQPELEISDEVLKRLNKKLTTFTVSFAKN